MQGQQIHPNVATGTRTESLYVDSGSDQVNLFNGNLSYSLPVGEPIPVGPILRIARRSRKSMRSSCARATANAS